jgi:hypothetical protein
VHCTHAARSCWMLQWQTHILYTYIIMGVVCAHTSLAPQPPHSHNSHFSFSHRCTAPRPDMHRALHPPAHRDCNTWHQVTPSRLLAPPRPSVNTPRSPLFPLLSFASLFPPFLSCRAMSHLRFTPFLTFHATSPSIDACGRGECDQEDVQ